MGGPGLALLFDLDGTLVDTSADLLGALDDLRAELGLPGCSGKLPPSMAARGGRGILALGFPDQPDAAERWLGDYLRCYAARIARLSRPYPGVVDMLDALAEAGLPIGLVTNKPIGLTWQLLDALGWRERFAVVVGGDSLAQRKPAPDPILHACAELGVPAEASIMVGDDVRDIEAARAAGCAHAFAVRYGYIEDPDALPAWGADAVFDDVTALQAGLLAASRR